MKATGHLMPLILNRENFRLAWLKVRKGKSLSPAVLLFQQNLDKNLEDLRRSLSDGSLKLGQYRSFQIFDPKPRLICAAHLSERVVHHALMNILHDHFDRRLTGMSYACRSGMGTHSALLKAFNFSKNFSFFLKLDVRKYFDSIDHIVLKNQLSRIFKDPVLLAVLYGILDSYNTSPGKGIPIGNLTSQYFANHFLGEIDRLILGKGKVVAGLRYMDDIVIWSNAQDTLTRIFHEVFEKVNNLKLQLKPPIFGKTLDGVPFLGFLVKPFGIYPLRKTRMRFKKKAYSLGKNLQQEILNENSAGASALAMAAHLTLSRSRRFRYHVWQTFLGHEPCQTRR